jgi:hypothetical protein
MVTDTRTRWQVNPALPPSPKHNPPFDQLDVAMGYNHDKQDFGPALIAEGPAAIKIKVKKVKDENSVSYGI